MDFLPLVIAGKSVQKVAGLKLIIQFSVCSQPPATPENATPYPSPASATFLEGDTIAFSCNSVVEDIVDNVAVCQATGLFVPSAISPCAVSRKSIVHMTKFFTLEKNIVFKQFRLQ